MFSERSVGSNLAPENDARLLHGRNDDVRIVTFLRRALMEKIAVRPPRFQSRFHRRSGNRQIEEAQRSLIGFQFSDHRPDPPSPIDRQRLAPRRLRNTTRPRNVLSSLKDFHAFSNALVKDWPRMSLTSTLPKCLQPMLATLTDAPFDDPGWVFEDKCDGFRMIAEIRRGK